VRSDDKILSTFMMLLDASFLLIGGLPPTRVVCHRDTIGSARLAGIPGDLALERVLKRAFRWFSAKFPRLARLLLTHVVGDLFIATMTPPN
jgi:hypothetical protein